MFMLFRAVLLCIGSWLWNCEQKDDAIKNRVPIARFKDQYLYKQDLVNLRLEHYDPKDTVDLIDRYIHNWINKQILIAEAEKNAVYKKVDIERKTLDYKHALIVHSYIENLVNSKLDSYVSDQEISQYYQKNKENFPLKYPVIKGKFIVLPKDAPEKANLKYLLISKQVSDSTYLASYCSQFAKYYSLDDTIWLNWNDLLLKTPFGKIKDKNRLLKSATFTNIQDAQYIYYLKIDSYKAVGGTAPVELVQEKIVNIILYKRKLALANQIKEDILQKAKANYAYTIYDQ